jgi:formyltetrahydrofolate deformylase
MTQEAPPSEVVLSLTCPDQPGIVHAVSAFLLEHGGDIVDSQQFSDRVSGRFFMRVDVRFENADVALSQLRSEFATVAEPLAMQWTLTDVEQRQRVAILVSRFGHCLNDLLFRWSAGQLTIDIPLIVSNHRDLEPLAGSYGIPFVHVPVTPETKQEAEQELLRLVKEYDIDLVVLARYMQILSDELCEQLAGRAINIHHSFLPSFKGGKPYHQAHDRGVKLVGATAHYVTAELDEGPIIEQEVVRVNHSFTAQDLVVAGRDVECIALARAVQWHAEHRILLNGHRTVILR